MGKRGGWRERWEGGEKKEGSEGVNEGGGENRRSGGDG